MTPSPTFAARATKLFKDLALALFNATMVLIIVASVSAFILLNKVDTFSKDVAQNAASAAIGAVGLNPGQMAQKLDDISTSISDLNGTLKARKTSTTALVAGESSSQEDMKIERLTRQLNEVNLALNELVARKSLFTDQVIEKTGAVLSESLIRVRDCSPADEQKTVTAPSS